MKGKGEPNFWEKNLSHYSFVLHKFDMDWDGIESGCPWWQASDQYSQAVAFACLVNEEATLALNKQW